MAILTSNRKERLRELKKVILQHKKLFPNVNYKMKIPEFYVGDVSGVYACPGGFAALHKPFNKIGLKFKTVYHKSQPVYKDAEGKAALMKFFNLSEQEANYLFYSVSYGSLDPDGKDITPTVVAERIDYLIMNIAPTIN